MDDALCVAVSDTCHDFLEVVASNLFWKVRVRLRSDVVEQLLPLNQLHDDVEVAFVVVCLVVLDYVRVVKFGQNFDLLYKAFQAPLKLWLVNDLNRHLHLWVVQVMRGEDLALRPAAKNVVLVFDIVVFAKLSYSLFFPSLAITNAALLLQ